MNQTPDTEHATDFAHVSPRPAWTCDVCFAPVDRDGSIYISYREWEAYVVANAAWERDHTINGLTSFTGADLADMPELRWYVSHDRCDPKPYVADVYWIGIERVDTWAKVAEWSAHLHDKRWFPDTDWGGLLYRAGVGAVDA